MHDGEDAQFRPNVLVKRGALAETLVPTVYRPFAASTDVSIDHVDEGAVPQGR